jgi:MFS family permease
MQHAVLAARTIATARSTDDERAELLGYIGASYGLGFAVGPAVGGWLSSYGLATTAWAAAAGSLLALVIVALGVEQPGVRVSSSSLHYDTLGASVAGSFMEATTH